MDKDKALTLVKRYTSTAETHLRKADREYAYYKNEKFGDPQAHYLTSQQCYSKAKEMAEKTLQTMDAEGINDPNLRARLNAIILKCNNNR